MKNIGIEIKWGIIFSLVILLWSWLEKSLGLHSQYIEKHATFSGLFSIVAILIIVLALLDKRKNFYKGKMTWFQGFISGLIISIVVTLFTPLTQYIISTIITPEYFPNIIEFSVQSGKLSLEEAQQYFNLKHYIFLSSVGALGMGVLTSAVVAIFVKRK